MAFVEFGNELDSGRAMVELQGFRITLGIYSSLPHLSFYCNFFLESLLLENPILISFRQSEDM